MMQFIANPFQQLSPQRLGVLLLFILTVQTIPAQDKKPGPIVVCPWNDHQHVSRVSARPGLGLKNDFVTAQFNVTYTGFENFPEAQAAFQLAVDIWSREIVSLVPIEVEANFAPLEDNVLGSAGAVSVLRNFSPSVPSDQWYAVALANAISNQDLAPDEADIVATFNSNQNNFYFGLDGNPPNNRIDFVSVVLHELGHGLGFFGSASVNGINRGSIGLESFLVRYDGFVRNGSGQGLTEFPNNSITLGGQLQSNDLFFTGDSASFRNGGTAPPIFAPSEFDQGSSFSHWDEDEYPAGNTNSLMTPSIGRGEVIQDIGDITRGMMQDLGWQLNTNQGVLFGSFSAFRDGTDGRRDLNDVRVTWSTIFERNNAGFEVQKSIDGGETFTVIGNIDDLGDSDSIRLYDFTDPFAADGGIYQVRQISDNGQEQFTRQETISGNGNAPFTFVLFPNPALDEIRISFGENEDPLNPSYALDAMIEVEVTSISGRDVLNFEAEYQVLERSLALSIADLMPGQYILKLKTPWGEFTEQFVRY